MSKTYKKIEIVGTSEKSFEEAVRNGVHRAADTVKNMDWFEVTELRGRIDDGTPAEFQVTLKIGFRIE
jgi:flavin-binding protein dodecin